MAGYLGRAAELESRKVTVAESAELDHADFTDNTDATGTIDTGIDIPADSVLLGFELVVTEGFTGDTSAVADLGDGTDADLFNGANQPNVLSAASVGVGADPAASVVTADTDLHLTVEGGADWGSVTAGKVKVRAAYASIK